MNGLKIFIGLSFWILCCYGLAAILGLPLDWRIGVLVFIGGLLEHVIDKCLE